MVKRTQTGGTLALEGDRNKAMQDAQAQMNAHCQGPYSVIEEGEAVVGTDTVAGEDTAYGEGGESKSSSASTRQATEYRITYACGGGDGPPPGGPPMDEPAPGQP